MNTTPHGKISFICFRWQKAIFMSRAGQVLSFTSISFPFSAFLVLIVACINFINLSTARSEKRAKEIGIRKTMGSISYAADKTIHDRNHIIFNSFSFIRHCRGRAESSFYKRCFKYSYEYDLYGKYGPCFIGNLCITGLIAGSYPAIYLSSFSPISVLKGGTSISGRKTFFSLKKCACHRSVFIFRFYHHLCRKYKQPIKLYSIQGSRF